MRRHFGVPGRYDFFDGAYWVEMDPRQLRGERNKGEGFISVLHKILMERR